MTQRGPEVQIKIRNSGLTEEQRKVLRIERLCLVQSYRGFILVECRCCKNVMIFPASEEDATWSCATCDHKRLPTLRLLSGRTKKVTHERPHTRDHRLLAGAA